MRLNQVTMPALDVARSVAFYQRLGLRLIVDALPRYARLETPGGESTFSLHHAAGMPSDTGVVVYFECDDLDVRVADLVGLGLVFDQLPRDEPWRWREARLHDPSGNVVCLYLAGENRRFPPWRLAG